MCMMIEASGEPFDLGELVQVYEAKFGTHTHPRP